jgi:hypothetical protein
MWSRFPERRPQLSREPAPLSYPSLQPAPSSGANCRNHKGFGLVLQRQNMAVWAVMPTPDATPTDLAPPDAPAVPGADMRPGPPAPPTARPVAREIGGRDGPDPTRFGDWEKAGRCIDF